MAARIISGLAPLRGEGRGRGEGDGGPVLHSTHTEPLCCANEGAPLDPGTVRATRGGPRPEARPPAQPVAAPSGTGARALTHPATV